jgi:hypothetical protein
MRKNLTPFDMEYYALPRSEADRKTLAEEGWRELTKKEAEEFMNCRKGSPSGVRDYSQLCSVLEKGEVALRFYKVDGVCVYIKELGACMPLGEGEGDNAGLTLEDLRHLKSL